MKRRWDQDIMRKPSYRRFVSVAPFAARHVAHGSQRRSVVASRQFKEPSIKMLSKKNNSSPLHSWGFAVGRFFKHPKASKKISMVSGNLSNIANLWLARLNDMLGLASLTYLAITSLCFLQCMHLCSIGFGSHQTLFHLFASARHLLPAWSIVGACWRPNHLAGWLLGVPHECGIWQWGNRSHWMSQSGGINRSCPHSHDTDFHL